jgi:dTDP-4-dehydrorhamnose 3,5-epimerase
MKFVATPVDGAYLVEPTPRVDDRGFFGRVWCTDEFAAQGLNASFVQCNDSLSRRRGTLRGLHYQVAPFSEVKLIRCVHGAIFDVLVDLRPQSPTYLRWYGAQLTGENRTMMYVPEGCAHGYLTLEDDTEVIYPVTCAYRPDAERGVRWNDPAFGIVWPEVGPLTLSPKDEGWPDYVKTA